MKTSWHLKINQDILCTMYFLAIGGPPTN